MKVDFDTGGSAVDKLLGRSAALKPENDVYRLTVRQSKALFVKFDYLSVGQPDP